MKVVLAVLKLCGNRMDRLDVKIEKQEKKQRKSCNELMAKYIITPDETAYQIYFMTTSLTYIMSYFNDPYTLAFRL